MWHLDAYIGTIATIVNIVTFLFSIIPFINVFKGKLDYEETPTLIISTGYCNCVAWYFYSLFCVSFPLKFCNMAGIIIYLSLIIIYLAYETKKYILHAFLNAIILFNGTWVIYRELTAFLTEVELLENICMGTTFGCCFCSLFLIYKVIKEKNYRVISEITTIGTILSGIIWVVYGIMDNEKFFLKCQILRIMISIAEIVVIKIYKKKYPIVEYIHVTPTIDIEINRNSKIINKNVKNADVVSDKIDEDAEETDKIKKKPVVIIYKSGENK